MLVRGIGIVSAQGAGVRALQEALTRPFAPPASFEVDLAGVANRDLLKKIRRADKLSKMIVLAAREAITDAGAGLAGGDGPLGIVVGTSHGPHVTSFGFLDEILQHGDANVSPTKFSNSVHNAAASYAAEILGASCVTVTVTAFFHAFHRALEVAQSWLDEERCARVLVGAADQYGDLLRHVCDRKLTPAPDRRLRPFALNPTCQCPGEGAAFFLVEPAGGRGGYCEISAGGAGRADVTILDADGMLPDEEEYLRCVGPEETLAAYSPLFGSMMTITALNCAVGALMIRNQMRYASPVCDNPRNLKICRETRPSRIEAVRCVRVGCRNEVGEVVLRAATSRSKRLLRVAGPRPGKIAA